jgi:hypothetical protein
MNFLGTGKTAVRQAFPFWERVKQPCDKRSHFGNGQNSRAASVPILGTGKTAVRQAFPFWERVKQPCDSHSYSEIP